MPADIAAKRYAQAFFDITAESGDLVAASGALARIATFMSQPDQARVLENTRTPIAIKHQLIDAGLNDLPQIAQNFAHLLVNKGRTALATEIANEFNAMVEGREGITRAIVTTAVPLTDPERAALAARLQQQTGRRVEMETRVDPSIIGGVIVQIGDRLIDGSTRARLQALRDNLVGAVA